VLITNEFHEFCWSTISGTSDDGKVAYRPKSMHIFIMSKIRHSHRKYGTWKWCGTKHGLNQAKVWPVGHITLVGRPCVGAFPKTIVSTCLAEVVLKLFSAQRRCKEETWPAGLTSGTHTPNLQPEHCLTCPINTTVLPPIEGVKKVRFSPPPPPQGASKFNLYRVEREASFWGSEDFPACRESSELLEHGSSAEIHLGSMEFSEP
jgi:hypothetical protein